VAHGAGHFPLVHWAIHGLVRCGREPPEGRVRHATGTLQGDTVELAALHAVGAPRGWVGVPVSGHKGGVGHLMHASSAPGVAAALGYLRTGTAPGTPGLRAPEAAARSLALLTSPRAQPDAPRSALVNSFGFAGNNSSLVLTAPDGSPR
ncbi:hypothetical protein AB0M39_31165, partial [Streptomyces sp. NPDC051907]